MPYTNAQATPRSDIYALVMQANSDFNKLFIGDSVLPVKGEDVRRGIYMKAKLSNAQLLNSDAKPREQGAGYQRVNRKYDTDTYDAQEYGLEAAIDDSYEEEVDRFMNLEATEAMLLERSLRIAYEIRVAAAVQNSTTFTATNALVNYTAGALATANVATDVDNAKTRLLKKGIIANAVIMSQDVFVYVRRTTLLQNQIFGVVPKIAGQNMLPGEQDVARALGVDTLYVAKAPYNANQVGQVFSGGFVWSYAQMVVCQVQGGEYQAGGIGRTIQWTKDTTGLFTPETYRAEDRRSNIMRVRQNVAEKIIDETAAEIVTTGYA
jgi:hypothetical protein